MSISKESFGQYVREFKFQALFVDLGWDVDRAALEPITIEGVTFSPKSIAHKRGFKIIQCPVSPTPPHPSIAKLTKYINKTYHENILILFDAERKEQVWVYSNRKTKIRYSNAQDPERLYQRASGLVFTLEEHRIITIIDVTARVRENFAANAQTVTRRFYGQFKSQHTAMLNFIKGIKSSVDKEWYASLMLNRLMFCYFMQKKGFLNNDKFYLQTKLDKYINEGKDNGEFYLFYRKFLLVLFHRGFGDDARTDELRDEIGDIPYLNGGLFDIHEIEQKNPDIQIADEAFKNIFTFFDEYQWHLDTRDCATGNEISPDVLGYIFEQYINDRSSMGAYYTKEDITEYISRSTILPWLLSATGSDCPAAFAPGGLVWAHLKNSGDEYIFPSVRHGMEHALPDYIEKGVDTSKPDLIERRGRWNEVATSDLGLPTEIWRETVARRQRCQALRELIAQGGIADVADLITHNIDIVSFVSDLLETIEDPYFIKAFYSKLEKMTVLDPTCGSGAFLFAALNILEPLYSVCLSRMDDYLRNEYKGSLDAETRGFFQARIKAMDDERRPNKTYFIYKSAILNNLYGVDIMREAVETAKLRLFLKLASTSDPDYSRDNIGIEPLPDIDFNLKAGNTLIGYAREEDFDRAHGTRQLEAEEYEEAKRTIQNLSAATASYRQMQLSGDTHTATEYSLAKRNLVELEANTKERLNRMLKESDYANTPAKEWKSEYAPFHWFAEFNSVVTGNDGFDVIIGNPPYLELNQISYTPTGYTTAENRTVHGLCVERATALMNHAAHCSMILPLSLVSTQRMTATRRNLERNRVTYYSNFAWRPGKLFDSVNRALTIFICVPNGKAPIGKDEIYATGYTKWNSAPSKPDANSRPYIFSNLSYTPYDCDSNALRHWIGKISHPIENGIISKISISQKYVSSLLDTAGKPIYYKTTGGLYWKIFTNFAPKYTRDGEKGSSSREATMLIGDKDVLKVVALLSSSLFWFWYTVTSNLRDLNPIDILNFGIPQNWVDATDLEQLGNEYLADIKKNSSIRERNQSTTGRTSVQSFTVSRSKPIIDKIDTVLARLYSLTPEELDYIINYDIKYRVGPDAEE